MASLDSDSDGELVDILKAWPQKFDSFLASAQEHRLQILFTQVKTDSEGKRDQKRLQFRADEEYFYPASSIKICGAIAALLKVQDLSRRLGLHLSLDTPLCFHGLLPGEQSVDQDASNLEGGLITLKHELRKLFLVSDNESYNRMYSFVGQAELNQRMWSLGFPDCRLTHRLEVVDKDAPLLGGRVEVRDQSRPFCTPQTFSKQDLGSRKDVPGVHIGKGYVKDGQLVEGPMDFSLKNYMSLVDLHALLIAFLQPGTPHPLTASLSEDHRAVLLEAMLQYPSQSRNPVYDTAKYPDDYCKFFLPGLCRVRPKADWRIYNKVGRAYGFSIDNAYIVHVPSGQSFFLTAVVYTNANGILNDNRYEYGTADILLADLAEVLARFALGVPRERQPLTEPKQECTPSSQWPKQPQAIVVDEHAVDEPVLEDLSDLDMALQDILRKFKAQLMGDLETDTEDEIREGVVLSWGTQVIDAPGRAPLDDTSEMQTDIPVSQKRERLSSPDHLATAEQEDEEQSLEDSNKLVKRSRYLGEEGRDML